MESKAAASHAARGLQAQAQLAAPPDRPVMEGLLSGRLGVYRNELGLPALRPVVQMRPGNRALAWLVDRRWFTCVPAVRRHLPVDNPALVARAVSAALARECREAGLQDLLPPPDDRALLARHARQLAAPRAAAADRPTLARAMAALALQMHREHQMVRAIQARHPGLPVPTETLPPRFVRPNRDEGHLRLAPAACGELVDTWIGLNLDDVLRHVLDGMPELQGARGMGREYVLSQLRLAIADEAARPGPAALRGQLLQAARTSTAALGRLVDAEVRGMRPVYLVESLRHSELASRVVVQVNQGEPLSAVVDDRLTCSEAVAIAHNHHDFLAPLRAMPVPVAASAPRATSSASRFAHRLARHADRSVGDPTPAARAQAARLAAAALTTLCRERLQALEAPRAQRRDTKHGQDRIAAAGRIRDELLAREGQVAVGALLAVRHHLEDQPDGEALALAHLPRLLATIHGDPGTRLGLVARRLEALLGQPAPGPGPEPLSSPSDAARGMEEALVGDMQARLLGFEETSVLSMAVQRMREQHVDPTLLAAREADLRSTLSRELQQRVAQRSRPAIDIDVLEAQLRRQISDALTSLLDAQR